MSTFIYLDFHSVRSWAVWKKVLFAYFFCLCEEKKNCLPFKISSVFHKTRMLRCKRCACIRKWTQKENSQPTNTETKFQVYVSQAWNCCTQQNKINIKVSEGYNTSTMYQESVLSGRAVNISMSAMSILLQHSSLRRIVIHYNETQDIPNRPFEKEANERGRQDMSGHAETKKKCTSLLSHLIFHRGSDIVSV